MTNSKQLARLGFLAATAFLVLSPMAYAMDDAVAVINARPSDLAGIGVAVNGSGVKAGILELDNVDPNHPQLPAGIITNPTSAYTTSPHPTQVAGCIASQHVTYQRGGYGRRPLLL
jgi:hypothetical protein